MNISCSLSPAVPAAGDMSPPTKDTHFAARVCVGTYFTGVCVCVHGAAPSMRAVAALHAGLRVCVSV